MSPALAGGFLTTAPPGKPPKVFILFFLNLFLAALDLRCCVPAFSSCGDRGLLFVAVRGFLIAVGSPVAEHGL